MNDPQPFDDKVVLGIHTNATANPSDWDIDTDGHAWLTITRNGHTEAYGLWPNDHPRFANENPHPVSNIREGIENDFTSTADRYYNLNPAQVKEFDSAIKENVTWGYTNNCSSWANDTAGKLTGEHIKAHDNYGLTTPGDLFNGIEELEKEHPTSLNNPEQHIDTNHASSLGKESGNPEQDKQERPHLGAQTGDPFMDKLLNSNMNDPVAFKQAVNDLSNSAAGQAFRAEGQAMFQEQQNVQLQATVAQQQTQIQAQQVQVQTGPVMTR